MKNTHYASTSQLLFVLLVTISVTSTALGYCSADSGGCGYQGEYIYQVRLTENSSGVRQINNWATHCDGYSLGSATGTMKAGQSYDFTITTAIYGNPYDGWPSDQLAIWVDWNCDNIFNDSAELVYSAYGNYSCTGTITVPSNAVSGSSRMRIRLIDSAYDDMSPCGTSSWGEVEDYTITIQGVSGSVSGTKFDDADGDGTFDAGEPGLSDWEIYIDLDGDGLYDNGEPNATTEPDGSYEITELAPGTYTVAEIMQGGWRQTYPGGTETHSVTVIANVASIGNNFGNTTLPLVTTVTLSGYVTMDDGTAMDGLQVDLDLDGNIFTAEMTTTTDAQGYYQFDLDAPWTGTVTVHYPENWYSHWTGAHTDITTNITEDFVCYYNYDGGNGTSGDPYQIRTSEQLDTLKHLSSNWDDYFIVTADIDMSGYNLQLPVVPFLLSTGYQAFSGTFDGNGHAIQNLTIDIPSPACNTGMFGKVTGTVKNLGLVNTSITNNGTDYPTGAITAYNDGLILNCYSTGQVTGYDQVGGLAGINTDAIQQSYSTCDVTANDMTAGGLAGLNTNGTISNSYATGTVSGTESGGLVGTNCNATVTNCYSIGIIGDIVTGGGLIATDGVCSNSQCYGSYWDKDTSGIATSVGGTGLTTTQMYSYALYSGWDFDSVWEMCDGTNYPRLQWQPRNKADFVCPDGVEVNDLATLCQEWLSGRKTSDIGPDGCDGFVDYYDWSLFAGAWLSVTGDANYNAVCDIWPVGGDGSVDVRDLGVFVNDWLSHSACLADIADDGCDGFVNFSDWAIFAGAWLSTDSDANWNATCDIWPIGGDGVIDTGDLNVFVEEWLSNSACAANFAPDANDGYVDLQDFVEFFQYWLMTD